MARDTDGGEGADVGRAHGRIAAKARPVKREDLLAVALVLWVVGLLLLTMLLSGCAPKCSHMAVPIITIGPELSAPAQYRARVAYAEAHTRRIHCTY